MSQGPPLLKPIEEDDCVMTWEEFLESCKHNSFIDYDGFGDLATATGKSKHTIYPSQAVDPAYKKPEWATHVVWYNR